MRSFILFFGKLFINKWFVIVLIAIIILCVSTLIFFAAVRYAPINPEAASCSQLVTWFLLRDFATENEAMREQLVDAFEKEFGVSSGKLPAFEFSSQAKSFLRRFDSPLPAKKKSLSQRNARTLIKQFLKREHTLYAATPFLRRAPLLQKTAEHLNWWGEVQIAYCKAIGVLPPTQAELLRDFEETCDELLAGLPITERSAWVLYRNALVATMVARHLREKAAPVIPFLREFFKSPQKSPMPEFSESPTAPTEE